MRNATMATHQAHFYSTEYALFFDSLINTQRSQTALSTLVEKRSLNRNFIIFCIWFAKTGRGRLRKAVLRERLQALFIWNQAIVVKLQHLLDRLNTYLPQSHLSSKEAEQLKKTALNTYKQAEQLCLLNQNNLCYPIQSVPSRQLNDAIANLLTYLSLVKAGLGDHDAAFFIVLLSQAFPEIPENKLEKAWELAFEKHTANASNKPHQGHLALLKTTIN